MVLIFFLICILLITDRSPKMQAVKSTMRKVALATDGGAVSGGRGKRYFFNPNISAQPHHTFFINIHQSTNRETLPENYIHPSTKNSENAWY
jgi:hypothetical protein